MDFDQIANYAASYENSAADPPRPKLNVKATSRWSGLSVSTLNKLRLSGDGPPYIKAGRRVVYDIRDVEAWLAKRKRKNTSEPS
jgi:predicted DNA-binding transcriptional regulator AlpA